jgi:two-component system chemotaxis sensor kinase CheA
VRGGEIARTAHRRSIVRNGNVIPFVPLERALRRTGSLRPRDVWSAVVVEAGGRSLAVGVDRLVGTSSVVMRSLPAVVAADAVISGASLDGEGNPHLMEYRLKSSPRLVHWVQQYLQAFLYQ